MKYLVKVKVDTQKLNEFGEILQKGELDRSCIRGETYCLANDPAVGYSIWETETSDEFEMKFQNWKKFYSEVEIHEVISPNEAMMKIISQMR